MFGEIVFAGEEPAAKAIFQRDLVALFVAAKSLQAGACHGDEDGLGDEAGDIVGGGASMAGEASGGTFRCGDATGGEALVNVEHGAHFGVDGGDLHSPPRDPAQVSVIVEIERAGIPGVDDLALQTGGGEDQDLRAFRDIESFQDGDKKRAVRGSVEFGFASIEVEVELSETVFGLVIKVAVRWFAEVEKALGGKGRCRWDQAGKGESDGGDGAEGQHSMNKRLKPRRRCKVNSSVRCTKKTPSKLLGDRGQ